MFFGNNFQKQINTHLVHALWMAMSLLVGPTHWTEISQELWAGLSLNSADIYGSQDVLLMTLEMF